MSVSGSSAEAAAAGMTAETVAAIVEAFNRHDVDAIMSYFADDAVWVMARGPHPWGPQIRGRPGGPRSPGGALRIHSRCALGGWRQLGAGRNRRLGMDADGDHRDG